MEWISGPRRGINGNRRRVPIGLSVGYFTFSQAAPISALRTPLFLAPFIPGLLALGIFSANAFDLWFAIVLLAVTISTASFMRLLWQIAHYQDFNQTREFLVLRTISFSAVPLVILAVALHFLI